MPYYETDKRYSLHYWNEYELPGPRYPNTVAIFRILLVNNDDGTYEEKTWFITPELYESKKGKDGTDFEIEILKFMNPDLNRNDVAYLRGYWGHVKEDLDRMEE